MGTHVFQEWRSPSLLLPWKFGDPLESYEKLSLKVQELVEVGEEEMYRVLVNDIPLR